MKVSYCALGCKVNLYESEAIVNEFVEKGWEFSSFDEVCDVYIINTCTVTSTMGVGVPVSTTKFGA